MTMLISTITSKGQTTIPEELRKDLALEPGQRLLWEKLDGKLVATPTGDLMALAGSLKSDKPYLPKGKMRKIVREHRAKHYSAKLSIS
jgi:AbrB family looped-hinge helix DNA binding protein